MKKVALISMMAVAVLGLMTVKAWSADPPPPPHPQTTIDFQVNIVNSGETPIQLSLANNGDAQAQWPDLSSGSLILQPGESTYLFAQCTASVSDWTLQYNIIYSFYDGTASINQRVSLDFETGGHGTPVASSAQSGIFFVSQAKYIDDTFTSTDYGDEMASWMGLSGTGEEVVSQLIDWLVCLAGFDPTTSYTDTYNYSINIGQQDYNIDKLAGVDWSNYMQGTPPSVTFVKGLQIHLYNQASQAWLSSQNLNYTATIADFAGANVSIGEQNAYIANYSVIGGAPQILDYINFPGYYQNVVQISRNPNGPQCMAAFGDSSVWYSDGTNVTHLYGIGSGTSAILQMCVNWGGWNGAAYPQILVGCADEQVEYYNGTEWTQLLGSGATSIMQLSAYWDSNNNLQAVAGLGNGDVYWWNGSSWTTLYRPSGYAPVYQLHATFTDGGTTPPQLLASLFDGSIVSYNNGSANLISKVGNNYCIIDVAPVGPAFTFPTFLAGFSDGSVQLYDGVQWWSLQPATGNRVQFLSADWDSYNSLDTGILAYVYSINFQFYFAIGENPTPYPAIPSASSMCGNIGGTGLNNLAGVAGSKSIGSTGLADLISVVGSKWYIWFASSQYSTRCGPYDLGIAGKPATGDIDGDGQDDLIMVKGSLWYAWLASSGYTQRIGPCDLGIVGKPLTGDIDGDGQDDLIMVNGSCWYYWPSSSGYTQRISLGNFGIHGLPAVGDIDGDGLVDLFVVVGSKWYVWFSASQYSTHRSYNMGVSGAPATGDIDGDGLADLIVIVGSDWYVWFSTSQYLVRCGPYTLSAP